MTMPGAVSRIAIVVVGVFCTWLTAGRATLNGIEGPNNGWLCILLAGLALLWARRTDSSREVAAGGLSLTMICGAVERGQASREFPAHLPRRHGRIDDVTTSTPGRRRH